MNEIKARQTRRRWKVALLASAGFSKTEISGMLDVSRRTVVRDFTILNGRLKGRFRPSAPARRVLGHASRVLGVEPGR